MKHFTLRRALACIVLLATLPAFLMTIYSSFLTRQRLGAQAMEGALQIARHVSSRQDGHLRNAEQLLRTLALMPAIREMNLPEAQRVLDAAAQERYTGLGLTDLDGNLLCNSPRTYALVNLTDRAWFQETLQGKALTYSGYIIGRISGKPVVVVATPVKGDNGEPKAVLHAAIDLTWLDAEIQKLRLPQGTTLIVEDRHGVVLAHYPARDDLIGKPLPAEDMRRKIIQGGEGPVEAVEEDGVKRSYVCEALGGRVGGVSICVGLPTEFIFGEADRLLLLDVVIGGLTTVVALFLSWHSGLRLFLRPMLRLSEAAHRLGEGDLTARSDHSIFIGREMRQVAQSFDSMAQSIEERAREARQAQDALQESEERLRTLFRHFPNGAVLMFDRDLRFLLADGMGLTDVGLRKGDLEGKTIRDAIPEQGAVLEAHFKNALAGRESVLELEFRGKFHECRFVPIRNEREEIAAGLVMTQDVTTRKLMELRLKMASRIDPLTGVANRRCFDETFQREWNACARRGTPLAMLMIDVDCFKAYNDHYGHQLGDACLRRVAGSVASALRRPSDFLARYGGEEFVALLPDTDQEGAARVAEAVRSAVAAQCIAHELSQAANYVTVSVGSAVALPARQARRPDLLSEADAALYRAKNLGRNRVEGAAATACA